MDGGAAISDLNSTNINALTPILSTPAELQRDLRPGKQPLCSRQTSLTKAAKEQAAFGGDYHFTKKQQNLTSKMGPLERDKSDHSMRHERSAGSFSQPDLSNDVEPTQHQSFFQAKNEGKQNRNKQKLAEMKLQLQGLSNKSSINPKRARPLPPSYHEFSAKKAA